MNSNTEKSNFPQKWENMINSLSPQEKDLIIQLHHLHPFTKMGHHAGDKYFQIENGCLTELSFHGLDKLQFVSILSLLNPDCENTCLKELRSLSFIFCNIEKIPNFQKLKQLRILNYSRNKITKIEHLNLPNLENLNLSSNKIHTIENLECIPQLKTLFLANNQIQIIENLKFLTNLKFLNLNNNRLLLIEGLEALRNLEELYLGGNKIRRIINLDSNPHLKVLALENNLLQTIENLSKLISLEELYLDNNPFNEEFVDAPLQSAQFWVNRCQMAEDINFPSLPMISFIGYSKSGKSSSIEAIIGYYSSKNQDVIALKNIHREGFTADTPGKNTWRFSKAGAKSVVAQSLSESTIFFNWVVNPLHLIKIIHQAGLDDGTFKTEHNPLVILEGFRDLGNKKILCVQSIEDIRNQLNPSVIAISGCISTDEFLTNQIKKEFNLPVVNLRDNPEEIEHFIV